MKKSTAPGENTGFSLNHDSVLRLQGNCRGDYMIRVGDIVAAYVGGVLSKDYTITIIIRDTREVAVLGFISEDLATKYLDNLHFLLSSISGGGTLRVKDNEVVERS